MPFRPGLTYLRLFVLFIFACILFQAARTTYAVLSGHEIQRRKLYNVISKQPFFLDLHGLRRVDLDADIVKLENYIFQEKPWTFPRTEKKRENQTWKRHAKLINQSDIKLIPKIKLGRINCKKLIRNDTEYMNLARNYMEVYPKIKLERLQSRAEDCDYYTKDKGYVTSPMTQEELEFPLAYSMVVYKDSEMVERIMRTIYRPQNFYCIHIDSKAEQSFFEDISAMTKCFDNVFIASERIDVKWGTLSLLLADLVCMRDLLKYEWEYYINLTGQEFPLRNNFELVQVYKSLRGSNDLESTFKHRNEQRYETLHDVEGRPSRREMPQVPLNITVVKGNMHGSLSRGFVEFLLNDKKSKRFFDWVKHTGMPEETYFATINSNPHLGAPGSSTGGTLERQRLMSREIRWYTGCGGKIVRGVCVNGIADLKRLTESGKLFLNKFHLDYEYLALDCFEQWFYDRSRQTYSGKRVFNLKPYQRWINDPSLRKEVIRVQRL